MDHVENYRLPKEIREKEEEKLEANIYGNSAGSGTGRVEISAGHAYTQQREDGLVEMNGFDVNKGVNVWSTRGVVSSTRIEDSTIPLNAAGAVPASSSASATAEVAYEDVRKRSHKHNKSHKHHKHHKHHRSSRDRSKDRERDRERGRDRKRSDRDEGHHHKQRDDGRNDGHSKSRNSRERDDDRGWSRDRHGGRDRERDDDRGWSRDRHGGRDRERDDDSRRQRSRSRSRSHSKVFSVRALDNPTPAYAPPIAPSGPPVSANLANTDSVFPSWMGRNAPVSDTGRQPFRDRQEEKDQIRAPKKPFELTGMGGQSRLR